MTFKKTIENARRLMLQRSKIKPDSEENTIKRQNILKRARVLYFNAYAGQKQEKK